MANKKQLTTSAFAAAWNNSIRQVTMCYHWGLVQDYPHLIELMALHQAWLKQVTFKDDGQLLEKLVKQWPEVDEKPRIWACFHIGPYGLIPRILLQKNRGVTVLLKDEVYEEQRNMYAAQFMKTFGRQPTEAELRFVRSGEADCLTQLKRSLTDGLDIVCFVDGQEGSATEKGWTTVGLHGVSVPVRYGIAVLSRWTDVAVSPVIFSLVHGAIKVRSLSDFQPAGTNQYQLLMQYCYDLLHSLTAEEMVQWEFASSFFGAVVLPGGANRQATIQDPPWWLPIMTSKQHLLIDVRSGKTVVVSETEHLHLCHLMEALIVKLSEER